MENQCPSPGVKFSIILCLLLLCGCADIEEKKTQHYQKGLEYLNAEKHEAAIIELRNAVKIDPKYAEARYQLGLAYLKTHQPGKALGELERAASLDPDNTDALIRTAEIYLAGPKLEKSRERIEKILETDKDVSEAYALLAQIELSEKNIDAAEKAVGRALKLAPGISRYHIIHAHTLSADNRIDEAEKALKKAVEINPEPRHLKELATFYIRQKKDAEAEKILRSLIEKKPGDPAPYMDLARFYMTKDRQGEAEQNILTAIGKDPESTKNRVFLASFYRQTRAFEKAEKAYKEAIAESDDASDIKAMLGDLYYETGKFESASKEIQAVLSDQAQHPMANLVKAKLNIREQKNTEALRILDRLTREFPRWGKAYYLKGVAHLNKGEMALSLDAANQAIQFSPRDPDGRTLLAHHLFLKKDFEAARNNAAMALQQAPDNFRAGIILARSFLSLGEVDPAFNILNKMESYAPENIEILYNKSKAELARHDILNARGTLEKILDLSPDFSPALVTLSKILIQQGQADQAIAAVKRQLQKSPNNADYMLLLAGLMDRQGASSTDRILEILNQAREVAPENPRIYTMMAGILAREGEIDRAIEEYRILTQKKPGFAEGYMALGTLLDEKGDRSAAKQAYLKVLELSPDFAAAANNLAWLLANSPEPDLGEALRLALSAKENAPDDPYIADTLGWVHYKRGSHKLALTQFSIATEKRPASPSLRYHLALALYADGQTAKAKEELKKCLETDKNFPEYADAKRLLKKIG